VPTTQAHPASNPLLTPAEVAAAFRVDPKTVTRWAKAGKLSSIRTLGGHRRYLEAEVLAKLAHVPAPEDQPLWLARSSGPAEDM
jgi:excisionase family DNA binding protein